MGKAASKMKRPQANELVQRLLEKYESDLDHPPGGSTYQECYDVTTGKPDEAYVKLYNEVKEELVGMAVPLE
jgi:hypothetical protein